MIEIYPELASRPPLPLFADHFCHFLFSEMQGFFDSRRSLELLCRENQRLREVVDSLHELLGVPRERIGCSGSLAYGYYEEPLEDVDATFFGTVEQNFDVVLRIAELLKREPEREVRELGKSWPLRFKHMGTLVCPFSVATGGDPVLNCTMELTRPVGLDHRHGRRRPPHPTSRRLALETSGTEGGAPPVEVVIYDGAQRGRVFKGDRGWVKAARKALGGRAHEAAWSRSPRRSGSGRRPRERTWNTSALARKSRQAAVYES